MEMVIDRLNQSTVELNSQITVVKPWLLGYLQNKNERMFLLLFGSILLFLKGLFGKKHEREMVGYNCLLWFSLESQWSKAEHTDLCESTNPRAL
jgi:hypothetical protein